MINRRLLYWGVFFITMGAVVLIGGTALVNDADVLAALGFWPVLVIALGVGLLLRRTRFSLAGGMLAAAMPGLLLGGLIVAAPDLPDGCGSDATRPVSVVTQDGSFSGSATVDLRLACGEVTVVTAPGTGWQAQTGGEPGHAPVVVATADRLAIASATQRHGWTLGERADLWRVTLPTTSAIDLAAEVSAGHGTFDLAGAQLGSARFTVNAGDARLDLSQATASNLSVELNAARVRLTLPAGSDLTARLSVNAGALSVCAPDGLGLRIHEEGNLASFNAAGLVRSNGAWETPGYALATHHADMSVSANVGSVDVNPEGGCR